MFDRSSRRRPRQRALPAPLSGRFTNGFLAVALFAALSGIGCKESNNPSDPGSGSDASVRCASWGKDGAVDTLIPSGKGSPTAMLVGADGKVFVAGNTGDLFELAETVTVDMTIARYESDGTLDTSYGEGGFIWIVNSTNTEVIQSVVAWEDGSLAVGGAAYGTAFSGLLTSYDGFLARFTPAGAPDLAFGDQGFLRFQDPDQRSIARPMAAQAGGKLVAMVASPDGKLVRYGADGELDASFGEAGEVLLPSFSILDTAAAPDGALLVAGLAMDGPKVLRFTADGAADASFGAAGVASLSGKFEGIKLAAGPSGDVFGLWKHLTVNGTEYGIVHVSADGTEGPSFAAADAEGRDFSQARSVTVDPAGHAAVVGLLEGDDTVVKYLADGAIDADFGQDGLVNPASNSVTMAARGNGELLVAGQILSGNSEAFRIMCFNP